MVIGAPSGAGLRSMSRLTLIITLVALAAPALARSASLVKSTKLCNYDFCKCISALHPSWTTVNCTVPKNVKINILDLDLPSTLIDLTVIGAESLTFGAGAFNGVADIRQIEIINTKLVVFGSFAAVDLSIVNLAVNIDKCGVIRFEKNAFVTLQGPLTISITDCEAISVEGKTFSWLLNMFIYNAREVNLGPESFTLEPTAVNVGVHGPGMTIEVINATIPELTKSSFGSSAARVYLEGVDIHSIRTGAFSANTYNIVIAINCSIHFIEEEAFSQNSLINYINLDGCKIQQLASKAFRSAMSNITINHTRFDRVDTGAINTTVASVTIKNSEFHEFKEQGFELHSSNILQMENNSFDELPPNAISAPGASVHTLIFNYNEIETMHSESLSFIGKTASFGIDYHKNYYGQACYCNMSQWLAKALGVVNSDAYEAQSYCTVNEVLARCFNVMDQNMLVKKFMKEVCIDDNTIYCEKRASKGDSAMIEIKNPRFPHKSKSDSLSARNQKVIGIVLVSCLVFMIIAIMFSLYKWWRRGTGGCANIKATFISLSTACATVCGRLCICGSTTGIANARSISQLSVNEYSERHQLNELRVHDLVQESRDMEFSDEVAAIVVAPKEEKFTQTLPEELTKELLENLKERLDNPDNYVEAREMIEHLYELTKITERGPPNSNMSPSNSSNVEENIYDLPYQYTTRRAGPDNLEMVSVGTKVPSLDKLTALVPVHRKPAIANEYIEPRDLAVHLYAEIVNNDKEKRTILGAMPDVIAEQIVPRGPYLRAVLSPISSVSSSPAKSTSSVSSSPRNVSSSIKSISSGSPGGNMVNRPLPEKPLVGLNRADPGEGPSSSQG